MAYVPVAFILAGMAAYTVLAGADFGAGLWTLLTSRRASAGPTGSGCGTRPGTRWGRSGRPTTSG